MGQMRYLFGRPAYRITVIEALDYVRGAPAGRKARKEESALSEK
jgi:hypothetical protein